MTTQEPSAELSRALETMSDGELKVDGLAGDTGEPTRRHAGKAKPDHEGARRARSSGHRHADTPGRSASVTRRGEVRQWRRASGGRRAIVALPHTTSTRPLKRGGRRGLAQDSSGRRRGRGSPRRARIGDMRHQRIPGDGARSHPQLPRARARRRVACVLKGPPPRPGPARPRAAGVAGREPCQQAHAGPAVVRRSRRLGPRRVRRHAAGRG